MSITLPRLWTQVDVGWKIEVIFEGIGELKVRVTAESVVRVEEQWSTRCQDKKSSIRENQKALRRKTKLNFIKKCRNKKIGRRSKGSFRKQKDKGGRFEKNPSRALSCKGQNQQIRNK